jgi:hypothetical protein
VRELVLARRAGVLAAAAACGALVATPALADVSVTPTTAAQETGENFTFHVTNTGTEPIGTVTLKMPEDTPVAEVYPLSVDDWAPKITDQKLSTPLPSLHDDIPTDEVTSSITWIAMPDRPLAPGRSADLTVAIGPLPDVSQMRFTVATTYANGKPGPAMSPAAVALTPATAAQLAQQHAGHDGSATGDAGTGDGTSAADDQSAAENAQFAKAVNDATRGPSFWSIAGPALAVLALIGGGWLMWRGRHRAEPDEEPDDTQPEDQATPPTATTDDDQNGQHEADDQEAGEDQKEPATAGRWSFKG